MHRLLLFIALLMCAGPAAAVDGCRALLCFAYPGDPRSIPECAATVEEVLRELALGGSFPACDMVSAADTASVRTGSQPFYPCAGSYGPDRHPPASCGVARRARPCMTEGCSR